MPRTMIGSSNSIVVAPTEVFYCVLGQANFNSSSTNETNATLATDIPGSVTSLAIKIRLNSLSTAAGTLQFRKNGANGNLTASVAAGTTGTFTDSSHLDTLAANDTFLASFSVASGGTGDCTISIVQANFASQSSHSFFYWGMSPGGLSLAAASTTSYQAYANGATAAGVAEADLKFKSNVAGTSTNLQTYISANARSSTTTWNSRINGANGALTLSVGASTTGHFRDTTNSDTISAGDLLNYAYTTGTGGSSITLRSFGMTFSSTSNKNNVFISISAGIARAASGTANYYNAFGTLIATTSTSESTKTMAPGYPTTFSNLMIYLTANTYSAAATYDFRKNSASGNQTMSITASTTGLFEDTTHSDTLAETDTLNYRITGGTSGSITFTWMGILNAPTITPFGRGFVM